MIPESKEQINSIAPRLSKQIQKAAAESHNEQELKTRITPLIKKFAEDIGLPFSLPREERFLIRGKADAIYTRLVVEYEHPRSLRQDNSVATNKHAIKQVQQYLNELIQKERHKPERVAGVVLDGGFFIFIRWRGAEPPLKVNDQSTARFLRWITSLFEERPLTPENLIEDFGGKSPVLQKVVSTFYDALTQTKNNKVKTLFNQWSHQFKQTCDYEEASKLNVSTFAKEFGVHTKEPDPFCLFFSIHTYYATFIKLLALQIVHYYYAEKLGTDIRQAANYESESLKEYFEKMERGGIFKDLGIDNFLEADFFGWYPVLWNNEMYKAIKGIISTLANYSLVTLDVDPDQTRDLLKNLYQNLMPKDIRHNLGEYYTPDWLAERLLVMLYGSRRSLRPGYLFKTSVADIRPDKRLLDPACGSGTFLVIAIKRIREYASEEMLHEPEVLEKILGNVVGFDLNPLAVITARTSYLLALGELFKHRKGNINIPVYLCDSIMTPSEEEDIFEKGTLRFNTTVGRFAIPKTLARKEYIDDLANLLEDATKVNYSKGQFISRLTSKFPLNPKQNERDINTVYELYVKLLDLQRKGINGIWARIIKNAFAPLFIDEFDYVAGNPPWVNWQSLPEQYRLETKALWFSYGLFPHSGMDTILGKGKKDISMIMTYVAMDKYLKHRGKLGFVITQSVFKTGGAGQGFRRFKLGEKGLPVRVSHVDDMVELQPFEGASNRTSIVILQKGKSTQYPLPYTYWRKTTRGRIPLNATLEEVENRTQRKNFWAEPVDENDFTSSWLTGRKKALKVVKKGLGVSHYRAHAGAYTGGANGIYWVNIIAKRPGGLVVISNITEGAKRKVDNIQVAIETDLLYPLLRGRNVKRWKANPSAHIIMAQDPVRRRGIEEDEMKTQYPKAYTYLKGFEQVLKKRKSRGIVDMIKSGAPFYTMFAIGDYTLAPYKVVWREQASYLTAAVIGIRESKCVIPDHKLMFIDCRDKQEAHYICALLGSGITRFTVASYAIAIQLDTHILQNIRIPKFDSKDKHHLELARLSEQAHKAAGKDDQEALSQIEEQIDNHAAELWGLSKGELKEIKIGLEEIS